MKLRQQKANGTEKNEEGIDDRKPGFLVKYKKQTYEKVLFRVSMLFIICYCCGLALFGFAACISLAVLLHFDEATRTHCNVVNYLPTISAAFGAHTPEKYIWRICICLHLLPRFFIAFAYANFYLSSPMRPMVIQFYQFASICCKNSYACALRKESCLPVHVYSYVPVCYAKTIAMYL